MWLSFYNHAASGDVLLLTQGKGDPDYLISEREGDVTLIRDTHDDSILGINIHNISDSFAIEESGQVFLDEEQVELVNAKIKAAGFDVEVEVDNSPKFVVGYVESCVPHEDSDHLSVTQTKVGEEVLQIVCGAKNIAQGQQVLVAKPGAVLPSGSIIWSGALRGVKSDGMICSTRELNLADIEDLPGIWELESQLEVGMSLDEVVDYYRNK